MAKLLLIVCAIFACGLIPVYAQTGSPSSASPAPTASAVAPVAVGPVTPAAPPADGTSLPPVRPGTSAPAAPSADGTSLPPARPGTATPAAPSADGTSLPPARLIKPRTTHTDAHPAEHAQKHPLDDRCRPLKDELEFALQKPGGQRRLFQARLAHNAGSRLCREGHPDKGIAELQRGLSYLQEAPH